MISKCILEVTTAIADTEGAIELVGEGKGVGDLVSGFGNEDTGGGVLARGGEDGVLVEILGLEEDYMSLLGVGGRGLRVTVEELVARSQSGTLEWSGECCLGEGKAMGRESTHN